MIVISAAIVIASYLLGAIPFGLLVARWQRGIDIRKYGSGSTGATNVLRTLGWRASAIVFASDLAKTIVPVLVARLLTGSAWVESLCAVAAIAGHCWPVYSNWSGGRGVTSSLGGLIVLQPILAVACLAVTAIVVSVSRFVSLGSLAGVAFGTVVMAILVATGSVPTGYVVMVLGSPLIVFIRHRENILRLLAGTERKIGQTSEGARPQTQT
ncbi:MAG TPA: glycerol-3-phosphate 1-O-acyltransferase PlsY [Chloroflexota bacterium]|nr:glycerol-3-phosphate 1-O-acyltransferase PlsY [Chloroflexota bacterium]